VATIVTSRAARKTEEQRQIMMITVCSFVRDASGSAGFAESVAGMVAALAFSSFEETEGDVAEPLFSIVFVELEVLLCMVGWCFSFSCPSTVFSKSAAPGPARVSASPWRWTSSIFSVLIVASQCSSSMCSITTQHIHRKPSTLYTKEEMFNKKIHRVIDMPLDLIKHNAFCLTHPDKGKKSKRSYVRNSAIDMLKVRVHQSCCRDEFHFYLIEPGSRRRIVASAPLDSS